jgi:lambda family phage portal protein
MAKKRITTTKAKAAPVRQVVPISLRARYDAAQTTADNRKHWANADQLSADSSASPAVRKILRNRARYEVANNSYARGVVETLANDTIGTGPRIQMLTANTEFNRRVEKEYAIWCDAIQWAEKLRTSRKARAQDGEDFTLLVTNPELPTPVKLDTNLVEADRITSPELATVPSKAAVDGIEFDAYGNPTVYHMLRTHPGGDYVEPGQQYDKVPASRMIHWFRRDRAEQRRGLPDIMPAMPLFAMLRRYGLAVLGAAENGANIAGIMSTTMPGAGSAAEVEAFSEIEFARNMMLVAPEGWVPSQMKAEQPSTTYGMGKTEFLKEIGRCINMPYCIVAGDSSDYNYASGRLDFQSYFRSISVDQSSLERVNLNPTFAEWAREAALVYAWWDAAAGLAHQWFWDGREHVDPVKEASAQDTKLTNGMTSRSREYGRLGLDWEDETRQLFEEARRIKEFTKEYGVDPFAAPQRPAPAPADPAAEDDDEEEPMSRRKSGNNGNGKATKKEGVNRVAQE